MGDDVWTLILSLITAGGDFAGVHHHSSVNREWCRLFHTNTTIWRQMLENAELSMLGCVHYGMHGGMSFRSYYVMLLTMNRKQLAALMALNAENATMIPSKAFEKCSLLRFNALPATITSIGTGAFKNCKFMPLNTLPPDLISIEVQTFRNCQSLALKTLPRYIHTMSACLELKTIDKNAFFYCRSLMKVDFSSFCREWRTMISSFDEKVDIGLSDF